MDSNLMADWERKAIVAKLLRDKKKEADQYKIKR
jgi:hypothetical protein